MADMQKLYEKKEKILSIIEGKGPSFPTRISKETQISPLFVSAYLSELVAEKKLMISHMKIGSSPIYFIKNQNRKLENFADYLKGKEKETFNLLKESEILEDSEQDPAIRFALRKIKDFAIPLSVRIKGTVKLFWKFFLIEDHEIKSKINKTLNTIQKTEKIEEKKLPEKTLEINGKEIENIFEKNLKNETEITSDIRYEKPKEIKKEINSDHFSERIKEYLAKKEISTYKTLLDKKKELIFKAKRNSKFGDQEYYIVAKDKKKISEEDLIVALQKAQTERMPAIFISPGELDKKAKECLEVWRNILKFDQIKSFK
jgi:hypothetical protein